VTATPPIVFNDCGIGKHTAIPNLNPIIAKLDDLSRQPSTNRSRMLEFVIEHSFIREKFVDGLKKQQNHAP